MCQGTVLIVWADLPNGLQCSLWVGPLVCPPTNTPIKDPAPA